MIKAGRFCGLSAAILVLTGRGDRNVGGVGSEPAPSAGGVTEARLLGADSDAANWLTHGPVRGFSPLFPATQRNVSYRSLPKTQLVFPLPVPARPGYP